MDYFAWPETAKQKVPYEEERFRVETTTIWFYVNLVFLAGSLFVGPVPRRGTKVEIKDNTIKQN